MPKFVNIFLIILSSLTVILGVIAVICFSGLSLNDLIYIPEQPDPEQVTVLRLANNHTEDYPTSLACDYFAELVYEKTNKNIKILCYHNSELGDETSTVSQLEIGGIDFVRVSLAPLANFDSTLNVLSLPYLYENDAQMWNVLNGEIGKSFLNSPQLDSNGITGLCWYTGGSRSFYSDQPLDNGLESLQGLRIRTQESQLLQDTVRALGAVPVPMTFENVYSALLTDKIDGAENSIPSYVSTQHYQNAKYIMLDEHSRIPEMIIASKTTMNSLSEEYQQIIKECAQESTLKQIELWSEYEKQSLDVAVENDCIIITPTEEQKAEFKNAVQGVKEKYSEQFGDLITQIENTPY